MSRSRKITVELTEQQYGALAGAVAIAEVEWPETSATAAALARAWEKINGAWWAHEEEVR